MFVRTPAMETKKLTRTKTRIPPMLLWLIICAAPGPSQKSDTSDEQSTQASALRS